MKTTLKLMALLLCLVMLVPCIVACAGQGEGESTAPEGTTQAPTEAPTNEDTGATDPESDTNAGSEPESEPNASEPESSEPEASQSEEIPTYSDPESESSSEDVNGGEIPGVSAGINTYTDLDNYRYKAYVRSKNSGNGAFYCEDFWVETYSSDPLSYAVYQRNMDIEDVYNCRITQTDSTTPTMYDEMKTFYLNDETYELGIVLAMGAASCATSNLLRDVYSLENIRLENATYDQNSVEQFTMGGKLYYFSGDMNISPLDSASVTIYNTDLYKTYDFGTQLGDEAYNDLYKMVDDGKWTVDAMLAMAKLVSVDSDNSGGTLDATLGDTVGYYQYSASAQYYWYGCGARVSELDIEDGGYPSIVYGGEKAAETFEFLYKRLNTKVENPTMPVGGSGTRKSNYETGQTLFTDIILWDIRKIYHENDYSYGILPIPKMSADQDRYFDVVYYPYETAHLWTVPTSCANADYASFLLNVIAVYSARPDNTMDAYYTKTLELSVAQDAGSRATLKIVRDCVTYDICLLYDWGGFIAGTLGKIANETANRYADATAQDALDVADEDMNKTLQGFKEPQEPDNSEA